MDEEIIEQVQTVSSIHETLTGYTGKRLRIRANMGRSKIVEREGVLTQAHPSLFIIETTERRGRKARQSYQYVDVLTGMVELTDLDTNELLFPEIKEEVLQYAPPTACLQAGAPSGARLCFTWCLSRPRRP